MNRSFEVTFELNPKLEILTPIWFTKIRLVNGFYVSESLGLISAVSILVTGSIAKGDRLGALLVLTTFLNPEKLVSVCKNDMNYLLGASVSN